MANKEKDLLKKAYTGNVGIIGFVNSDFMCKQR